MGLLQRLGKLVRANVNAAIAQAEDPEQALDQALMDMQDDLVQLRQAVAQAIATQKRTERQREAAARAAEDWYQRAQQLLNVGDEPGARSALSQCHGQQDAAAHLQEQWETQQDTIAQLRSTLRDLEAKLLETRTKRDLYVARARSAMATQRMHDTLNYLSRPNNPLERLESWTMELEARAQLSQTAGRDPLEQAFQTLESDQRLERDLEQLKARRPPELR
ncbi:PspA/IM30 family protein [Limnothrix redekei]|uniref:PspA/IM30 family protein n=1 Tax=Limnothrix redekei LRLZ20PSL1 TaxID=3112953 RepID=A0ABW7C4G5_9CYAN